MEEEYNYYDYKYLSNYSSTLYHDLPYTMQSKYILTHKDRSTLSALKSITRICSNPAILIESSICEGIKRSYIKHMHRLGIKIPSDRNIVWSLAFTIAAADLSGSEKIMMWTRINAAVKLHIAGFRYIEAYKVCNKYISKISRVQGSSYISPISIGSLDLLLLDSKGQRLVHDLVVVKGVSIWDIVRVVQGATASSSSVYDGRRSIYSALYALYRLATSWK